MRLPAAPLEALARGPPGRIPSLAVQLYSRAGKWYAEGYYVTPHGTRRRWRRSTGVRDDGSARARKLAEHAGYQLAQSLAAGLNRTGNPTTIKAALGRLIVKMEVARRAQPTIDIVTQKSVHLFAYFGPSRPCESITAQHLQDYARTRMSDGAKPLTIDREIRTLRQAMRAAGIAPPTAPDLGRVYTPREVWYDHEQQARLVQACHPAYRDHVILYLSLGLRASELYRLEALDLAARTVRVRGTKTAESDRTVPVPDAAASVFRRRGITLPRWRNSDRDLKGACRRAKLPEGSLNALRHSYATVLARAGVQIGALAEQMGHASPRMLERVYAHLRGAGHAATLAALPRLDCAKCVPDLVGTVDTVDK